MSALDGKTASEEVTLLDVINMAIDAKLIDLHVSLPARVESFDASNQTVEVTIMINRMVPDGATPPNFVSEKMPELKDVPVGFMRGGGFFASFPLKKGDPGMLHFSERPLGAYRSTGAQGDPGDLGMHTLDGAWFVPAVAPDKSKLQSASDTNMVLGKDGTASAQIEITPGGEVHLGAGATKGIARAGDPVKILTALLGGLLATWMSQVEGVCNGVSSGAVAPLSSTFLDNPGIEIKSGSNHEKAAD